MATEKNGKKPKTKTTEESGIAENQKANYTAFPPEESEKKPKQQQKKTDIKETEDDEKVESGGGDLAGNAAGNTEPAEDN